METEKSLKSIRQGKIASSTLEILDDYLQAIEVDIIYSWKNTQSNDKEGRERLFSKLDALQEIRKAFNRDINGSKVATVNLKQK